MGYGFVMGVSEDSHIILPSKFASMNGPEQFPRGNLLMNSPKIRIKFDMQPAKSWA
jgi:hypothetical protein